MQNKIEHTSVVTTVTPGSPGIPRAMVLTVSFALSLVNRALLPPSPAQRVSVVAVLIPASGDQDHTTSPSACNVIRRLTQPTSIASRALRSWRLAKRPSCRGRTGRASKDDLPDGQSGKYFRL